VFQTQNPQSIHCHRHVSRATVDQRGFTGSAHVVVYGVPQDLLLSRECRSAECCWSIFIL